MREVEERKRGVVLGAWRKGTIEQEAEEDAEEEEARKKEKQIVGARGKAEKYARSLASARIASGREA